MRLYHTTRRGPDGDRLLPAIRELDCARRRPGKRPFGDVSRPRPGGGCVPRNRGITVSGGRPALTDGDGRRRTGKVGDGPGDYGPCPSPSVTLAREAGPVGGGGVESPAGARS